MQATEADGAVEAVAEWIAFGLQRGFLVRTEVHGFAGGPRPSKKSLTMKPVLIDAVARAVAASPSPLNPDTSADG